MTDEPTLTLTIERHLLEHPQARHIRRMRTTIFLYLVLVARMHGEETPIPIDLDELVRSLGLPLGTIRSWLGHLARQRYITVTREKGALSVALPTRSAGPNVPDAPIEKTRTTASGFTADALARALGETGNTRSLEDALTRHPADAIKRALAGALAPPADKIRRSRTALFLYLLNRNAHTPTERHPRA